MAPPQVGTGDRSEKIKTYNYKDGRCSDHRLKQNYGLNQVHRADRMRAPTTVSGLTTDSSKGAAGLTHSPCLSYLLESQTLDGEIEDNIQAMISLDQQERMKELANEMAVV